jgi:hypothetical protein
MYAEGGRPSVAPERLLKASFTRAQTSKSWASEHNMAFDRKSQSVVVYMRLHCRNDLADQPLARAIIDRGNVGSQR